MAETPLDSFKSHRFGYIISNEKDLEPAQVIITPYLHENRIYLNRIKPNTKYFYTSIESSLDSSSDHHHYTEGNYSSKQRDDHENRKKKKFTSIICVNLTEFKFYCYNQSGKLINRFNFQKQVDEYGVPMQNVVSSNGKIFIFKKNYEQLRNNGMKVSEIPKHLFTLNIMVLDELDFHHVK